METGVSPSSSVFDYDVVGLGFCCLDDLLLVNRIPSAEEQVTILERAELGGGMAATAMVTVTRLGGRAAFVGSIGTDGTGTQIRDGFKRESVDITQMFVRPDSTSHRTFVLVDERNACRSFLTQFGDCGEVPATHLDPGYLRRARILHLSDSGPTALQAAAWAREVGQEVCYDGTHFQPDDLELLPLVDYLIVSRFFGQEFAQAQAIPNDAPRVVVGKALRDLGPAVVVISEGELGAGCIEPEGTYRVPAFSTNPIVDTTGAGDVYHGAFLCARAKGKSVKEALLLGSATAAIKCQQLGGRAGIPTLNEAEKLLANYQSYPVEDGSAP